MGGIDSDTDLSFLVGKELGQIGIGKSVVNLRFHDGVSVAIFSSYDIRFGNRSVAIRRVNSGAAYLLGMIGKKIDEVELLDNATLYLEFSNYTAVVIFDHNEHGESYRIAAPGVNITV